MKYHKKDVADTYAVDNSLKVTMKFHRKDAIIAEQFDGTPEMAKKYDLLQPFADQGYLRYYLNYQAVHIGDWFVYDGGLIPRILSDKVFKKMYEPARKRQDKAITVVNIGPGEEDEHDEQSGD